MADFWERKRQELLEKNPKPVSRPPAPSSEPWWSQGTSLLGQRQTVPQNPVESRAEGNQIDGHDVSKAQVLQGRAEECPMCPPNPESGVRGNMYRPTPNSAMRCFDCGYMENNRFLGQTVGISAVAEGPSYRARQTNSGGAQVNNYHGDITSVSQAVGRLG